MINLRNARVRVRHFGKHPQKCRPIKTLSSRAQVPFPQPLFVSPRADVRRNIAVGLCQPKIARRLLSDYARRMKNPFRYFDSSPDVIRLVVMMYVKYPLSLRNVGSCASSDSARVRFPLDLARMSSSSRKSL
jgi:hypothetical protein